MLMQASSRFFLCIVTIPLRIAVLGLHLRLMPPSLLLYNESTNGYPVQQLFSSWRAKMHPKDINLTRPVFLHLAESFIQLVAHLDTLFPICTQASRPTLSHPDYHFSNILVLHDDPTVVTGVVDWEFAAVVPFWDAYEAPGKLMDFGEALETNLEHREEKRHLRSVYYNAVVAACPDATILEDPGMRRNIQALRLFKHLSTSGVSLYSSCQDVMASLLEIKDCITQPDNPGSRLIDGLILSFSRLLVIKFDKT